MFQELSIFSIIVVTTSHSHCRQGCGVGRFFRIPTPAILKNRVRLQHFWKPDYDSSNLKKTTPTPDSDSSWKHATENHRLRLHNPDCHSLWPLYLHWWRGRRPLSAPPPHPPRRPCSASWGSPAGSGTAALLWWPARWTGHEEMNHISQTNSEN